MKRSPSGRVEKRAKWRSQTGASALEMAFLLLLIVVVAASAVVLFGLRVEDLWQRGADASDGVANVSPGPGPGNTGGGGSGLPGGGPTSTTTTTLP
jgi:hypothetical protein